MSSLSQFYGATNVSVVKSIQKFWLSPETSLYGGSFTRVYYWGNSQTDSSTKIIDLPQTVNPDKTSISFNWQETTGGSAYSSEVRLDEVKLDVSGTQLLVSGPRVFDYYSNTVRFSNGILYVELIEYY